MVTARPTVGRTIEIVVRGSGLPDASLVGRNPEIWAVPNAKTDVHGWPTSTAYIGTPVLLHRVSDGVYRGSFVLHHTGRYSIVAWSYVFDAAPYRAEVENKGYYFAPVPLRVAALPTVAQGTDSRPLAVAFMVVGVLLAGLLVLLAVRTRTRRELAPS